MSSALQSRFAWVFRLLEQNPEERTWDAEWAFPDAGPEEQLRQARAVREWLNKSPLGRRPLVKVRIVTHALHMLSSTNLIVGKVQLRQARAVRELVQQVVSAVGGSRRSAFLVTDCVLLHLASMNR